MFCIVKLKSTGITGSKDPPLLWCIVFSCLQPKFVCTQRTNTVQTHVATFHLVTAVAVYHSRLVPVTLALKWRLN